MSLKKAPAEIANDPTLTFQNDVNKLMAKETKLMMLPLRVDKKPFQIMMQGQLATNGIIINQQYNTHSFAFKWDNLDDGLALESLQGLYENIPSLEEYEYKPLIKNDTIWIKCKFRSDKSAYSFQSNFKINPKKPGDAPLYNFTEVIITAELMGYISPENKTYGFSMNVHKLDLVHPPE